MKNIRSTLYWSPRILTIIFIIFISLFALDVFGEGYTFWESITALLIHLIPSYILIAALLVAWKWGFTGGLIFILLGCWYLIKTWGQFPLATYFIVSGPAFLVGVLFIIQKFINYNSSPEKVKDDTGGV